MFVTLRPFRSTSSPDTVRDDDSSDYLPCMFVLGLGVGFAACLLTGSFLIAAGGALLGALIGLALAN